MVARRHPCSGHGRLTLLVLLLAGGCDFSTKPSVAPRASLSGTIAYQGPRPRCRDTEIDGDIILQLYRGRTTSPFEVETPVDTVRIEVEQLFNIPGDCGTAGPPVMRELPFEMRNVGPRPSATEAEVFRLVAFWDRDANHDEDDPLREQPTFGDIYGAAYENAAMIPRRFRELVLEPPSQNPDGQQVDDVLVTMDGEVRTERPLFRMATMAALSSAATIPTETDAQLLEDALFALTETRLDVLPVTSEPYRTSLAEAGVSANEAQPLAFWSFPVDPSRVGTALDHPTLPSQVFADTSWDGPRVIMRRARTEVEEQGGVPDVFLIPALRPSLRSKIVHSPGVDLLVPPIAVIDLNPELPVCQIQIVPPGNIAPLYEDGLVDCQELPSGPYSITVAHGVAGGMATMGVPPEISDTGFLVTNGDLLTQTWQVPNSLQDLLVDQGDNGRFLVSETDPLTFPDAMSTLDGHGIEACTVAEDPEMMMPREVQYAAVPPACCAPIADLCGLPLCDAVDVPGGAIRQAIARDGNRPNCLPFLMPASCCR